MIKMEKADFERVLSCIKEVDLKDAKETVKKTVEKTVEKVSRLEPKKKVALAAFVVFIVGLAALAGGSGKKQKTSQISDVNQLLSDSKASIQMQDNVPKAKNSVILDELFVALKTLKLSGIDEAASLFQENRTIKVPQEAQSIQKAIDEAKSGDVVMVSAGEYKESITMKDGVSVIGENAQTVILDGDKKGNVVTFKDAGNKETRFENFTVKNSGENLSGIMIENSSPIINRNILLQNDYDVYIKGESSPIVQRNRISESKAGVQVFNLDEPKNSNPVILDNVIFGNKKGINLYKGGALIEHNTVSFNSLIGESGATFGIYLANASADIKNNIITDNGICELCSGIYADEGSHDVKINYNDLWNNQGNFVCFGKCDMGGNNISDDPHFEDSIAYNLSLKADSPFLASASDGQRLGARL